MEAPKHEAQTANQAQTVGHQGLDKALNFPEKARTREAIKYQAGYNTLRAYKVCRKALSQWNNSADRKTKKW